MKTVDAKPNAQDTLFDIYAPVERYFHELQLRHGVAPAPPVRLQPEDSYLMHLFVGLQSHIHAVIDLAAGATWGATTVLWAAQARETRVLTSDVTDHADRQLWAGVLEESLGAHGKSTCVELIAQDHGGANVAELISRCDAGSRPVLVVVTLSSEEAGAPSAALDPIFAAHPGGIALVFPVGLIGEDRRLGELLDWTQKNDMRLTVFRELSPFLAGSRLAVVAPKQDMDVVETLKRLQRLFTSNFDFLTLAHQTYTSSRANAKLETDLKAEKAKNTELELVRDDRENMLRDTQRTIEELDLSAQGWARECERIAVYALQLEDQIRDVTSGRIWSWVQRLSRIRHRLIPQNSLRERWGRSLMRVQRHLRGWLQPAR